MDSDIVKKNHELQHGNCTNRITRSAGRATARRIWSSIPKMIQELHGQNQQWREYVIVDPEASQRLRDVSVPM